MEWKRCMNVACGVSSTSVRWHRGWVLRSGDFAVLCDKCGSAYERSKFCDVFHSNDSGWRQCNFCGKHLHCGCIASRYLFELQDTGGVSCINCAGNSRLEHVIAQNSCIKKVDGSGTSRIENVSELQCTSLANQLKVRGKQVGDCAENDGLRSWLKPHNVGGTNVSSVGMKQDATLPCIQELGSSLISHFHGGSSSSGSPKANMEVTDRYKSLAQTNLSMTLGAPLLGNSNPFHGAMVGERGQSKTLPLILPGLKFRPVLPMFPVSNFAAGLEAHASMASRTSAAMPPPRRRGRNQQLRPRYWPRFTDQELQQISGDSNSTIVPLFEKMLSASDAGPIGRMVLPKACAEVYFPPISQPEGLPLQIHDVHGNIWDVQFRFWPNNNSRMYVLEGVSPCIQSMQLKAGDTVTFSRMDPEGKLIMGFRKATPSASAAQSPNGGSETSPHDSTMTEGRKREGSSLPPLVVLVAEEKRIRNIGSKSKRLLIDSNDALELKITWEEAQDLFRPPPSVNPSVLMIEDHAFEEYEEPPIFGKRSIFIVRSNRINEQWTQCDSCSKWRKLPVDILLPAKWTCMDNIWDQNRCSCSAPNELTPREVDNLVKMMNKEFKKQREEASPEPTLEHESSGLDALADAALLEDNAGDSSRTPVATTPKHSQHVPGCSCIVCVQQPSARGKHKPTCNCDACTTSLMMQRMNHQSKHEAETAAHRSQPSQILTPVHTMNEAKMQVSVAEAAKGQLDLNCQPNWEDIPAESKESEHDEYSSRS